MIKGRGQIWMHGIVHGAIKPLLKWAGGKTQLLGVLRMALPSKYTRYVEPFVGGAALFLDLAPIGALISDSNPELINFYVVARDAPDDLIKAVKCMPITKENYYLVRGKDPLRLDRIERAARFIYLNKTCYNGLYRVNRQGSFNTPFGRKTNVRIIDEDNLYRASTLLKETELQCSDFSVILGQLKGGEFVYLDPPYMPVGRYSDFRRYTCDFFSINDHVRLAKDFAMLANSGVSALLSNSLNKRILDLYKGWWYTIVMASRQINCDAKGRGKIQEILIANYPVEGFNALS